MQVRSPAAPAGRGASAAAAPSSPTGSSRLDGAAAAGQRRRFHFSDIPVRGDDGTTAPVSAASYGVSSTTIAKFRSTDVVRPPSLAQRSARKDQRNLAALIMIVALTRAREAGRRDAARPARSAWSVQRQLAARFDGEVAGGAGRPARPARAAWTALR